MENNQTLTIGTLNNMQQLNKKQKIAMNLQYMYSIEMRGSW